MAPITVEKVIGWALTRRTRRAEMLRRQLLSDVVTVLLFLLGLAAGLPVVDPVDFEGNFTEAVPPYAGTNVFEANKAIIRDLKAAGKSDTMRHDASFAESGSLH